MRLLSNKLPVCSSYPWPAATAGKLIIIHPTWASLSSLLGPGDDISYRLVSSQSISYGRIIRREIEVLTVCRYASDVDLDDTDLPEVFYNLQELVQTEDQVIISIDAIVSIIFVLSVQMIASYWYDVEGILSCFFIRYRLVRQEENTRYESKINPLGYISTHHDDTVKIEF